MAIPPPPPATAPQPDPQPITIRLPSKYRNSSQNTTTTVFNPPPLTFLHRTWSVTHSTLSMWRAARNVRITYGPLPPSPSSSSSSQPTTKDRLSDLVEYEPLSGRSRVKRISGTDTASSAGDTSAWDWRGSGLLFFVGSHWEVLGWGEVKGEGDDGEEVVERWVVTWFQETVFTKEGVDVYFERREGGSEGLVKGVLEELGRVVKGQGGLGEMVEREMREVEVRLPWKEE